MALFKQFRGNRADLDNVPYHDGHAYFCVDDGTFHIDYLGEDGALYRKQIRADEANALAGYNIVEAISNDDTILPTAGAVYEMGAQLDAKITNNYDETIIGLTVSGNVVTYVKGDGSTHSFETQDTNTTYSLGTDTETGLTKLYATTGSAEDGTMTQKAIKTELDKKISVSFDEANDLLVFFI